MPLQFRLMQRFGRQISFAACIACALIASSAARAQQPADAATTAGEKPALATKPEDVARQHFQLGRAQYDSGQFREAAASFERAYENSKREVLWYNIYLAYRDAGATQESAVALRNYLERVSSQENRPQLEARLATLERMIAENEAARKAQEEAQAQREAEQKRKEDQTQAQAPAEAVASTEESGPSIVPYVVMGVGGAMIVTGLIVGTMASSKHSELEDKCEDGMCDASLQGLADEGKTLALVADVLIFGGIATAATGGVLWFLNLEDDATGSDAGSDADVAAHLTCGIGTCGGRVALKF